MKQGVLLYMYKMLVQKKVFVLTISSLIKASELEAVQPLG